MTAERKIFISAVIYGILGLVAGFFECAKEAQVEPLFRLERATAISSSTR